MTGEWPVFLIDHKDLDPSNNRWTNLREATKSQNAANGPPKGGIVGLKGVKRDKKKWAARIRVRNVHLHLGNFDSPELAHAAYRDAADRHFGEFARME